MDSNVREFSDEDIRYLNRYLKAGLSIQEICQRLKRRPKIILDKISSLKLEPEDQLVAQKKIPQKNNNTFSTPLVVLSSVVFLLSLLLIYPEVSPGFLPAGYSIEILKVIILFSIPVGIYECGRSFIELFKNKPEKVRIRSKAKWTSKNERLLKVLADEGHSLKLLSLRLGFEKDDRYTESSVRGKLVKLNFYDRYLDKVYENSLKQVTFLTKKLGKDFGSSVQEMPEELMQDEVLSLLRHSSEKLVVLRPAFFSNPQTRRLCVVTTEDSIKIIFGYLNSVGGALIIGATNPVDNTSSPKIDGIFDDAYKGEEAYVETVRSTLRGYLPHWALKMVNVKVVKLIGSEEVCVIKAIRSSKAVFCNKIKSTEQQEGLDDKQKVKKNVFFIRQNGRSIELDEELTNHYIRDHFEH